MHIYTDIYIYIYIYIERERERGSGEGKKKDNRNNFVLLIFGLIFANCNLRSTSEEQFL